MSDLTNLENAISTGGVGLHQPELEQMRNALEAKDAEIARLREALRDVDRCLLAGAYMRARGVARAALGG